MGVFYTFSGEFLGDFARKACSIGRFFGGFGVNLAKTGFKNWPFFHFLRRFCAFLREMMKNNGF